MAETTSLSFPNMFDVTHNRVGVLEDDQSIVNRVRLLILTEPTEIYNNLDQGVGLSAYMWQYNTANTRAIIQERITSQLDKHEPCVIAAATQFSTTDDTLEQQYNKLGMFAAVVPTFGGTLNIELSEWGVPTH